MSTSGHFVWYDLLTNVAEAAKAFYSRVAGWTTQPWGEDSYAMWVAGETPIGGVMQFPQVPPYWMAHLSVDDVDAAARRAQELGGRIQQPPTDIPQVGRFAVVADPQGAQFSLFRSNAGSTVPDGRTVGHIGWRELHTTDHEGAWEFYRQLFGWQPATTFDMGPAGTYRVFRHPDDPQDGMTGGMFNGATLKSTAPHWLYYINVDTMEGALGRVREAGGKVLEGPMDVPGGGTSAHCMDPQGARFAVFSLR
jgi:predicted enzyme related to lactoylglutathione lyase